MLVGRGKTFGEKETKRIFGVVKNTPFHMHKRGGYKQASWSSNEAVLSAFGEYIHWYLKETTYPYGEPISQCWSHLYTAPSGFMGMHQDKEVPGGFRKTVTTGVQPKASEYFMGMHQDKHAHPDGKDKDPLDFHSTTLVIKRSDDLEGGEIVLAGDSYANYEQFQTRLKVVNLKVGETATWNGETVHGIAEITKGTRWVFVTFKDVT